jgi:DNA mismatch repair protein MutL
MKIRVLSEQTINQIAAGEVIENPASVVKELVENSCDAGATHITIETRGGGLELIRISDNGSGMGRDDAILSIERHATSKIRSFEDLAAATSMGFRGEALASIGAISHFSLTTSTGEREGTRLLIEGGQMKNVLPAARARGTTIEIASLFANVPARRKFQKGAAQCAADITRIVTQLALAHEYVGFTLIQNGEEQFALPAGETLLARLSHFFDADVIAAATPISISDGGVQCEGLLGSPLHARTNRTGEHLFIGRRPIVSNALSYAIRDGYGTRLAERTYPFCVLHLKIPSDQIDVNVHPQKREVRLRNEKEVKQTVKRAIEETFGGPSPTFAFGSLSTPFQFKAAEIVSFPLQFELAPEKAILQPVGLFDRYLLLEEKGKLLFVDMERAQTKLLYSTFLEKKGDEHHRQALLAPFPLTFSLSEAEAIGAHLEAIASLGIEIRAVGKGSFLVEALPSSIAPEEVSSIILAALSEGDFGFARERLALRMAKHHRKKKFMLQEALQLYETLLASGRHLECPEGKPIITCATDHEIGKFSPHAPLP